LLLLLWLLLLLLVVGLVLLVVVLVLCVLVHQWVLRFGFNRVAAVAVGRGPRFRRMGPGFRVTRLRQIGLESVELLRHLANEEEDVLEPTAGV
jgi:hypothetical protein